MKPHLQSTVFTLLERQKSQRQIQRLTGIDRKTIRRYQAIFESQKSAAANSPMVTAGSDAAATQTPPPPRPPATDAPSKALPFNFARSACEPYRDWIEQQVRLKRNGQAIYQDLVDQFGFAASYESVKRFVRALRHIDPEQFDRLEFAPGEEAQVDYGEGALTRDPKTGRYRRPRLFVMTLRYSRRSFRRVVWKSSKQVWAQLHEEAFRYFGGAVSYVVLDNLREGVITPDLYEPEINRLYGAMLEHYGVVADPARVRDPNRKGTVENAIQHTQGTALAGRRFESIEAQNEFLMHWEANWAAKRIHGRARRQVEAMFQEEKPHLRPLPPTGFRYFTEAVRTVWDDTTVSVDRSNYAARPAPIGSLVSVRIYDSTIEIRDRRTQALLRTHPRALQPGSLELPEGERPFNPSRQTALLLASAGDIGPQTKALCQHMFDAEGRVGQRAMWGIVGLSKKYPARLVEQACDHALRAHVYRYKQIRAIVERLFEQALERLDQASQLALPLTQEHPLIRPPAEYGELFTLGAQHGVDSQPPTGEAQV
ncbi:Integrase, catalytic region (plasmid) [Burkholderia vietnamiensis G4]|uniref:Integrase, catalytic region n=1 Tax=Burkholderia vietnamiensis (strain G4 / LMG 22486) TaxID=269482 RepID=A4JAA7_BURVG|nr:Integrase, catalytic region [Burkholderia vietnamiensis G4]ABO55063.1 Integrase, catalytic region [Burkholderia vietnamiensis G4]ABO57267.1 Integrase, catalytic region [Burkholderia vietnamiensis G4]ABO58490.1 Integrase, catalytic region [Burkholderia vietnamiensis G4]ABO59055.1 Integrase, catalytic region [Burkholderia vietnamiensis G4]